MMLKLKFGIFQDKLENERMNGHIPTVHCLEEIDKIMFVFKSKEKWDYYTVVTSADIESFAIINGIPVSEAVDKFRINYCSNTMPLEPEQREEVIAAEEIPATEDITKSIVDEGEDMIIEAQDYADFLNKFFDKLEDKVIRAAGKIYTEKSFKKSFGDFLTALFNSVNTVAFANQVKQYLKIDLVAGMQSAEQELDRDIGFTGAYQERLNVLQAQQVDGYTINGKKWPGIKGVTKEIQSKIIMTVQEGIKQDKSTTDIKNEIKESFSNFSEWRSEMIARTETTRIFNSAKLIGYKETGIPGKKVWNAAIDDRTSDICRRLNGQERELDEPFIDPETNKAFMTPPGHCQCRSSIYFSPD